VKDIVVLPHHFGMSVSDLDRAIDWFDKVLGFELDRKEDFLAKFGVHIAFIKSGDFSIELFQHDQAQPASSERSVPNEDIRTLGNKHMCFQTADLDAILDRLKVHGGTIAMGPFDAPGSRAAFILGPDGALVEVIQPTA
jgi:methylmalonyl-CoA/ethylmalonyl-CoA epimerase